jgi:hypothetical protein
VLPDRRRHTSTGHLIQRVTAIATRDPAMSSETQNKPDVRKLVHLTKIILMTLFVGYAASHCEGLVIGDNMFGMFGKYSWYENFLFTLKCTYGTFSSIVFYFLVFYKTPKEARQS